MLHISYFLRSKLLLWYRGWYAASWYSRIGSHNWSKPAWNCPLNLWWHVSWHVGRNVFRHWVDLCIRSSKPSLVVFVKRSRRHLNLRKMANAIFFSSSCPMRVSRKPSRHSSLAFRRLVLPTPILSRGESWCAAIGARGNIHITCTETRAEIVKIFLVAEVVLAKVPSSSSPSGIPLPNYPIAPRVVVTEVFLKTAQCRASAGKSRGPQN